MEWDKIGLEVCQNLIESMPRRISAVVKARGGAYKVLEYNNFCSYDESKKNVAMVPCYNILNISSYNASFSIENILYYSQEAELSNTYFC